MTIFAQAISIFQKMKRLFLILFLFGTLSLQAQHKPFQFGFRGGVNLGWFKTDNEFIKNESAQWGASWGFVADFFLMENYSLSSGFNVLYLNGETKRDGLNIEDEGDIQINGYIYTKIRSKYIQIPVIFTMKTNNIKDKIRIYGQIGYGLGILLQSKMDVRIVSYDGELIAESNGQEYEGLTATRSSLILGVGVEVPLHKSTYLRTGFTFDNCFIDVIKADELNMRNNFVEFNLAIIF